MLDEWLRNDTTTGGLSLVALLGRLLLAVAGGLAVAVFYRIAHGRDRAPTVGLTTTLVLLAVLIAMVSMVIDGSVARAFSLVGALSIVRFRTIVDDTRDTAFVIFTVVVGMAAGTGLVAVVVCGIPLVGLVAWALDRYGPDGWGPERRWRTGRRGAARTAANAPDRTGDMASPGAVSDSESAVQRGELEVRIGLETRPMDALEPLLRQELREVRLLRVETARQGTVMDVFYAVIWRADLPPTELIAKLTQLPGVLGAAIKTAREDRDRSDD